MRCEIAVNPACTVLPPSNQYCLADAMWPDPESMVEQELARLGYKHTWYRSGITFFPSLVTYHIRAMQYFSGVDTYYFVLLQVLRTCTDGACHLDTPHVRRTCASCCWFCFSRTTHVLGVIDVAWRPPSPPPHMFRFFALAGGSASGVCLLQAYRSHRQSPDASPEAVAGCQLVPGVNSAMRCRVLLQEPPGPPRHRCWRRCRRRRRRRRRRRWCCVVVGWRGHLASRVLQPTARPTRDSDDGDERIHCCPWWQRW